MAYKDLREFISKLEEEGELKRIKAKVTCHIAPGHPKHGVSRL